MHLKRIAGFACLLLLCAALPFLGGCATLGETAAQNEVLRAKNKVAPALVHVRPVKEVFTSGRREQVLTIGSGFIISEDGYVVTNEHVAGESAYVRCVLFDKSEVDARVVGVDPYTDIALLKLEVPQRLPHVVLGRSAELEAGQTVLALGSPHGLSRSVSLGIVSVTDRYLDAGGTRVSPFNTWIQTDAAINPGNSGGPLVNLKGEVVGINARVLSGAENVGFAIPVDTAREVIEDIIQEGRVIRASFGFELQEMLARTDDPEEKGVLIADVDPLSPAASAGVRPGDVLLSVNGWATDARYQEDLPPVEKVLAGQAVGQAAVLQIMRGMEPLEIEVAPVELSELKGREVEFSEWGFTVTDLTREMVRRAQLPTRRGVAVTGTQVGGVASNARLDRGDIILEVDGQEVENLAAFRTMYENIVSTQKKLTLLWVKRGALTRFVMIRQYGDEPPPGTVVLESPVAPGTAEPVPQGDNSDAE